MYVNIPPDELRQRRRRQRSPQLRGTSTRRQRPPTRVTVRQQLAMVGGVLSLLGVWFLTPVSDWIVSVVLITVPLEADVELGREAIKSFRRQYKTVPDKWGVNNIGWDLVDNLRLQQQDADYFEWNFGVIDAPMVNAFALPGGYVRVTNTLLERLHLSDGELAALLGHEMGHVIKRHSQARVIKKQLFSTILNAVFYEDHDDQQESFGQAVGELLLNSAQYLGEMKFSRQNEYEADAESWSLLFESRTYSPHAVESLLLKLKSLEGGTEQETSWESTHPGTKDRIEALHVKWDSLPMKEQRRLANYPVH